MKVGIIGTRWGLTHVGAFRKSGLEIAAIMGQDPEKTALVAKREGIALATVDEDDFDAMDVIVIASPARSHLHYLRRFQNKPILCEKPLAGHPVTGEFIAAFENKPVFVNYAFPFLATAREIKRMIDEGRLGEVFRLIVNISSHFETPRSSLDGFFDNAVHPLSWLNHVFGAFRLIQHHSHPDRTDISTVLSNGRQTLNLNLFRAHEIQLQFDITIVGTKGALRTSGGFVPGKFWNFTPVTLNGDPVTSGEYSDQKNDIWFSANANSVKVFVDFLQNKITRRQALDLGLSDIPKASEVETGLEGMLDE